MLEIYDLQLLSIVLVLSPRYTLDARFSVEVKAFLLVSGVKISARSRGGYRVAFGSRNNATGTARDRTEKREKISAGTRENGSAVEMTNFVERRFKGQLISSN